MRWFLMMFIVGGLLGNDSKIQAQTKSAADRYQALVDEFEEFGGSSEFAPQFVELAEAGDPVALKAIVWLLDNRRTKPEAVKAIALLEADHVGAAAIEDALPYLARTPATAAERLLRALIEKSPHPQVQAQACYYLAFLLEDQRSIVTQLKDNPELGRRALVYYGAAYGQHLASLQAAQVDRALLANYDTMGRRFADVSVADRRLGDLATQAQFRIQHLSVGRVAPEIKGQDILGDEFKLSDYRGKVVMLSFWGHW